jgi:2-dehydropantoate 2-reductase
MDAFTIIGVGGIGCALAYALRAGGARVTCVETDSDKLAWGRAHGLGTDARPPLQADFVAFGDWSPERRSTNILCTKCYDNARVLERIPPGHPVLPVQNGFYRDLEERGTFPEGIASFVSECLPGRTHTRITRAGALHLGMHHNGQTPSRCDFPFEALIELANLLRRSGIFRVKLVEDILPLKHTKLMYNAAIGPIAGAAGLDNGQLLSLPLARRLFFSLLQENYTILRDAGIPLGRIGPFHPDTVYQILKRPVVARALAWAFYPSLRGTYCSMYSDVRHGRSEIDHYNRYLIDLAGSRPCPYNQRVYEMVKRMEELRLEPGSEALESMASACGLTPVRSLA